MFFDILMLLIPLKFWIVTIDEFVNFWRRLSKFLHQFDNVVCPAHVVEVGMGDQDAIEVAVLILDECFNIREKLFLVLLTRIDQVPLLAQANCEYV